MGRRKSIATGGELFATCSRIISKTATVLMDKILPSSEGRFRFLIQERIKNFWGYGNLDGDVWFIGMEEGGDGSLPKLMRRYEATSNGEVFDIYDDMRGDKDHMAWFEENASPQRTYRRLIYLLLYIKTKKAPTPDEILQYQIKHFGRKKNDHAVLELMPMACRTMHENDWVYRELDIDGFASKKEYLKKYVPERVERLRGLIIKHKPKLVIFYSTVYRKYWSLIPSVPFQEVLKSNLYVAKDDHTVYAVVPHSVAHGMSNDDWMQIAQYLIPLSQ